MSFNRLIDDAGGRPLATVDALNHIESAIRFVANSVPEDGEESAIEVRGRQMVLDTVADALAVVAKRAEQAQKPAAVIA